MHQGLLSELLAIPGVLQTTLTDADGLIVENTGEREKMDAIISDIVAIIENSNTEISRLTIEAEEGLILADVLDDGRMVITKFSNEANLGKVRSLSSKIAQDFINKD